MSASLRLEVDGEVFLVTVASDGQCDYAWVSGRNPGYGFGSIRSDHGVPTTAEHEQAVRAFLVEIDPETGYLPDE